MNIGELNQLKVNRITSIGLFLADDKGEEVLLPKRYAPRTVEVNDELEVFIYTDSEDRTIATTVQPRVKVNQLAFLEVVSTQGPGAFLDWGLPKDLFVPKKEQPQPLEFGKKYLVYVYLDRVTKRLVASTRLDRFMSTKPDNLAKGDEVKIIVWKRHDLGFQVIVDEEYVGMVYKDQLHQKLELGERIKAYVNQVRPDGKVDVLLQQPGYAHVDDAQTSILTALNERGGFLPLHDRSKPEDIERALSMSKKSFKKAVGALYKSKKIKLEENGIRLT